MNKTLRTFIIIAAMLVATGQTWAALTTGTSDNLFVEPATGGTVTLYDNQGCTGDPITNATPGNTVYLKAVPDIIHGYPTTSIITVEKIVDGGAAQSRGTRRISAITIGLGEYVEVTAVGQNTGIFSFTMPDDGTSVSITVTFPDAPVSYINEAGQTVNTGNETVHILTGSETELDAGWYVAEGMLNYSECIWLNGDVHLILKDGAVMNVGTEESPVSGYGIIGTDYSFCIYAQSTGDSKGQLYVNATDDAICTKDVTICGGLVTANGDYGIYALNNVIISGGQVTATGSTYGFFVEKDLTISGGQVTANGNTYGIYVNGNLTLGWTNDSDFIYAGNYNVLSSTAAGNFAVYDGETLTSYLPSGTLTDEQVSALGGKTLRPATPVDIALTDDATDNASVIEKNNEALTNVTLSGRTLYKDGAWNTLCLPFALSTEQVSTLLGSNGQLMELDTKGTYETDKKTGLDGTTLYLYFKVATTIAAGKPYIIRWEGNGGSDNLVDPVFTNVVIDADAPTEVSFSGGKFVGTYDYMEYDNENKSILLLGLNNTLYYPQPSGGNNPSIGACRAYFHIDGYVTGARLSFGEAESQGIKEIEDGRLKIENGAGAVYDLQGRRMDSSILNSHSSIRKKGLYIVNGRKVVVR